MSYLEVITGCMYSGKTTKLQKEVSRYHTTYSDINPDVGIEIFNHSLDTRSGHGFCKTHDGRIIKAKSISIASMIPRLISKDTRMIGINEGHLFEDGDLIGFVKQILVDYNKHLYIVINGLDLNFYGEPFQGIQTLMSFADEVIKLHAYCNYKDKNSKFICSNIARHSQLLVGLDQIELPIKNRKDILPDIKGSKYYEPRCREHFRKPN